MPRIKKRADGRYQAQIYLGRDEDGRRKYKSVYGASPAELKEKETEVRHQMGKGLDMLRGRDDFAEWAEGWLRIKEAATIADKQKDNYRRAVKYWSGRFAGWEIQDVRAGDVERGLLALQAEGKARRTIDLYRSTIRQIMRRAVGRVIPANPVDQVELSAVGKAPEKRRALTEEEQGWIWATPGRGQLVAVIMMLSGLRRGELAALTWNDIDLDGRTITVNKTIEYKADREPVLKRFTKSAAGMRVIDIPQRLCDYLRGQERDGVLVVHTAAGGVMTESAWVKLWGSYMRELNIKYGAGIERPHKPGKPGPKVYEMTIPPITLHWLRHTFCTICYFAGVDVATTCAWMGHADVATTLRIYTHLDSLYKRKSTGKVDAYLGGSSNSASQMQVKTGPGNG